MRIVTYEDRQYDTIGLKLLLLSLNKHVPGTPIDVIFPSAPDEFVQWVEKRPSISLHIGADLKRSGYNVKPSVLLQALNNNADEVVWLDTDIIVTRDFRQTLSRIRPETFVITEEWFGAPFQGGGHRSKAWGFETGRQLPATTNSCVVRATACHRELLSEWDKTLDVPQYREAQAAQWYERPVHLQSDQEVLAALLESTQFNTIPLHYLKRGRDVAHCFQHQGYIAHQMIYNLVSRNKPYFVHGQGAKPWRPDNTYRYFLDVSAYTLSATEYREELGEPTDWLTPTTPSSKAARRLFGDNPWLVGLPLALYEETKNQRVLRTFMKRMLKRA